MKIAAAFFKQKQFAALAAAPLFAALLTFASCSSTSRSLAPVSSNEPFAENAPKNKEEEQYYRDVYSGDWRKTTNPLGYFGLGKLFASTEPPAHWNMQPPAGAKSMQEVYAENYERQAAASQQNTQTASQQLIAQQTRTAQQAAAGQIAGAPNAYTNTYPSNMFPQNGAPANLAPAAGVAAGQADNNPFATGAFHNTEPSPAPTNFPSGYGSGSAQESQPAEPKKEKSGFKKFLDGWSSTNRRPFESNEILRGQAPENLPENEQAQNTPPEGENTAQGTAALDPTLADRWKYVNRADLLDDSKRPHLPQDEYIADGGDDGAPAYATPDWQVRHLDSEDTVAHFDTLDGRILVEPSNRVHIYSPRFGAVRQVIGASSQSRGILLANTRTDVGTALQESAAGIDVRSQEQKTSLTRGKFSADASTAHQPQSSYSNEEGAMENISQTRLGDLAGLLALTEIGGAERQALFEGGIAAAAWGEVQSVRVEMERTAAEGTLSVQMAESVFTVENGPSKTAKLALYKIASKKAAAPGELVEFTLRYENIGGQTIGNVTILDNLSTRLEYVPNSAKSSRKANFSADPNQTGSSLLRLEIIDPLEPKAFGVFSFLCKVR